jgi:hypothetical protein
MLQKRMHVLVWPCCSDQIGQGPYKVVLTIERIFRQGHIIAYLGIDVINASSLANWTWAHNVHHYYKPFALGYLHSQREIHMRTNVPTLLV